MTAAEPTSCRRPVKRARSAARSKDGPGRASRSDSGRSGSKLDQAASLADARRPRHHHAPNVPQIPEHRPEPSAPRPRTMCVFMFVPFRQKFYNPSCDYRGFVLPKGNYCIFLNRHFENRQTLQALGFVCSRGQIERQGQILKKIFYGL